MKKIKLLTCATVIAAMAFAFGACGSSDTTEEATEEPAVEETTAASDVIDLSKGIKRTDNEETGESTVESDVFKLTLPNGASWDYEVVEPSNITFYNKKAKEGDFGGTLFTLQEFELDDESYDVMPSAVVGQKGNKKIVAVFTSDVQYDFNDEAAQKEYMEVYDVVQTISDDPETSPLVLK